jgi:hypothetical protein
MTTILARQIQFPKMHIRNTTPSEESTVYSFLMFWPPCCTHAYYTSPSLLTNLPPITHMYLIYKSRFVVICSCATFHFAHYLFKYLGHKTPIWGNDNFRRNFLSLQLVDIFLSLPLFFGGNIYTRGKDFCVDVYKVRFRVCELDGISPESHLAINNIFLIAK